MLGWARRLNLRPMCPLMCWLLSSGLCGFAVLVDRWQVILDEFPGRCTQCARSAHTVQQLGPCRWVVFRGAPGIHSVIIGAVRAIFDVFQGHTLWALAAVCAVRTHCIVSIQVQVQTHQPHPTPNNPPARYRPKTYTHGEQRFFGPHDEVSKIVELFNAHTDV